MKTVARPNVSEGPLKVTSAQNARFKSTLRLRQARARRETERIVIDGLQETRLALDAGVEIVELWIRSSQRGSPEVAQLVARGDANSPQQIVVDDPLFQRLCYGNRADAFVAIARTPQRKLDALKLPATPCVLLLERIEKPGNIGAIIRSADGAGIDAVVLVDPVTDLFNPNTIRASRGTVFTLPTAAARLEETLAWIRAHQLTLAVARVDGSLSYNDYDFRQPTALVLGNEADGVSPRLAALGDVGISLPMCGRADSLNVSNTAAVLSYTAYQQRHRMISPQHDWPT